MGDVWQAWDEVLDRAVALKLLRHDLADRVDFRRRFRAEAQAAARLSHPGAVNVFDYDEHHGVAYLVMELIAGEPISAVLRRYGTLSVEETMTVVAQTASVLAAAHGLGMVHRDIKPANLLLQPDGRVKVTDFGIAYAMDRATVAEGGSVLGTVAYMSPEQVRGEPVSAPCDIYSLGVVAYQCLTGCTPFAGDSLIAVARAHLREQVPTFPVPVTLQAERLVRAMLEKDPSRRPASARSVAAAAARLAGVHAPWAVDEPAIELSSTTPMPAPPAHHPLAALALGIPPSRRGPGATADDDDWPTQWRWWTGGVCLERSTRAPSPAPRHPRTSR